MGRKRAENLYDKLISWIRDYPKVLRNEDNWIRNLSKELFCDLCSRNDIITEFLDDIREEMKDEWKFTKEDLYGNFSNLSRPQLEDRYIRYRNVVCKLENILDKNFDKISDYNLKNRFYSLRQEIKHLEAIYGK